MNYGKIMSGTYKGAGRWEEEERGVGGGRLAWVASRHVCSSCVSETYTHNVPRTQYKYIEQDVYEQLHAHSDL